MKDAVELYAKSKFNKNWGGINMSLFKLPEIDREKTKEAVEAELEKYRMCLLMVDEDVLPKVTQTFSLVPPSNTNEFHSSTENAAIDNITQQHELNKYLQKVRTAVNRLSLQERQIIIKRYFEEDVEFDYRIYNDMGLSERQYYRIKARAFYKLAFLLKVEVLVEKNVS